MPEDLFDCKQTIIIWLKFYRKKFASDLSIKSSIGATQFSSTVPGGASSTGVDILNNINSYHSNISHPTHINSYHNSLTSHRSDHDIHTPEHRSNGSGAVPTPGVPNSRFASISSSFRSGSPHFYSTSLNNTDASEILNESFASGQATSVGIGLLDSSDTHSISSTSFISAVSSQEDMTLVNLHMQVNKPIIDSPLLMSSYVSHLSQVKCTNWSQTSLPPGIDAFTVPLFQKTDDGKLVYIGKFILFCSISNLTRTKFRVLNIGFRLKYF